MKKNVCILAGILVRPQCEKRFGRATSQLWLAVWPFRNKSNKNLTIFIRTRWKHSFVLTIIFRCRNLSQTTSNDFISKGVFTAWMAREVGILPKNCFTIQITRMIYRLVPDVKTSDCATVYHMSQFSTVYTHKAHSPRNLRRLLPGTLTGYHSGDGRHWVRPHWLAASGQLGRSRLMTSRDRVLATTFVPVF